MQLRLNPAHPLCADSRKLVFATFGTGAGGQVLDLADRPSHGVVAHASTVPSAIRTLSSRTPLGFPSDYQSLSMRSSSPCAVSFGNPTKVTALTNNFSAAQWVRPWNSVVTVGMRTTVDDVNGWLIIPTYSGEPFTDGAMIVNLYRNGLPYSMGTDTVVPVGEWSLLAFSWSTSGSPRIKCYVNGRQTGLTYDVSHFIASEGGITASSQLNIGSQGISPPYCDIGPAFVWGSVLSADDIALLYRDTWGMVTRSPAPVSLRRRLATLPAGVSIASDGLVTWTAETPIGTYEIPVRAANDAGASDGLLSLSITAPPNPAVTDNTAGNTYGTGGTVQMAATNTPTSWSLQGSPPAGVSVDDNGLVSWTSATPVGAHSITTRATNGSGSGDGTLTLTVSRAALTVTADAKSRTYGAANPTLTGTITGFVNGETEAVLTGFASYPCAATTSTGIGTAAITAAVGSLAAANYSFTYVPGTLTITRAPLLITPDDKTRQIGAANPTLTGTITGFVNSETAAVLVTQPTYACAADTNTPVGTASITASGAAAANYSITYGTGTLTITMPVPVVTGGSLTRVYGVGGTVQLSATNTPTSWTLVSPPTGVSINGSGLVTVATSAVVQTAAITVGASNAGGSGIATLSLTITRAPLVVAANNKERLALEANPVFDGTITGYVLGETASALTGAASFTATATTESPAGAYVITAAAGTLAAANYAFTFVNGVLTITLPVQPIPTAAAQETAIVNTPAETLTRTAAVRAAGRVPRELRVLYDALLGSNSDATGIEARAAAFGRLLADPRYAALTGGAPAPAPALRPGIYLSNVPATAVVGVDAPASALTATDGRAELRVSVAVSAVGRYQIPNVPTAYIVVHSLLAPFTLDVTVRRAAGVVGGIGPGGDSTPAKLEALLTPAMRTALFGAQPSGVYAEAAALAESSRFDERLAGVLIALVRRIAALS